MIIADLFNIVIVDQILEERSQIGRDFDLLGCNEFPRALVNHRINIKFKRPFEHPAERFQDSALQVEVVFFVKDFQKTRDAHDQPDQAVGVTVKITCQPVVFTKLRNQDGPSKSAEDINAR